MKVTALGELLIDFSCRETNSDGYPIMDAHPGGAPANFLAAIKKFGGEASFLGKVGNDTFGNLLAGTLKEAGIGTEGLVIADDVFTTLAFVTFNKDNDREFSFARKPGADTCLKAEELNYGEIDSADAFHFGTLSLTNEPSLSATRAAVAYAKEKGKIVSFDPNLRKPLWNNLEDAKAQMLWGLGQADVVKISDEEVEFLFPGLGFEEASEMLMKEYGISLVYITLGKDGCLFRNARATGKVPGLKGIKVLDTTGAGDIFGGSAMYAFLSTGKKPEELEKEELEGIVRFACTSAGLSTTRQGGIGSVPEKEKVMEVING